MTIVDDVELEVSLETLILQLSADATGASLDVTNGLTISPTTTTINIEDNDG